MRPWQERFKSKVMWLDDSDDSCLIWVGALRDDGRGRFRVNGKERRAHRVAYELFNGCDVGDFRLVQECNHPQCVRHWRRDRPDRKLTPEHIRQILHSQRPAPALAVRYGVSAQRIRNIRWEYRRLCTDGTPHTNRGRACA